MHDKTIRRRRAVLLLLVVVSLILLTDYFGESPSSPLHSVQRGIVAVLSPIQDGASKVLSPVRDVAGWFSSTFQAKSQVARYKSQNDKLRAELATDQYDASEYAKDQGLLKLNTNNNLSNYAPVAANVIGKDPIAWYDQITVDQGSSAGVHQYDPVVGPGGLVGDVYAVTSGQSIVKLLTSPQFAVGAMVENGTDDAGILQPDVGDPSSLLLNSLPSSTQVTQNQEVVTSGFRDPNDSTIESFAPPGIPIGVISNADAQSTFVTNQQVQVTPSVDLPQLSTVEILTRPRLSHPNG